MSRVKLLDCTLRDGGYINNWEFGESNIRYIAEALSDSGTEIVEMGFLRDEGYSKDRAVWSQIERISEFLPKNKNTLFAIMGESFNFFPIDRIPDQSKTDIDIIRIICWRKLQTQCIEYCKKLIDKGYKVCIQPDRVNQYSIDEFKGLCDDYSKIKPYAIYVVDSNGFLSQKEILHYLTEANQVLPSNISLGYHGHNSLLQAEGAAELFVESIFDREIIVDGSVFGIGRASGNLNIEIFAKYLNENLGKSYNISKYIEIYQNNIKAIYEKNKWGYSIEAYVSSVYHCNPNYASILSNNYGLEAREIERIIMNLSDEDKVITNRSILADMVERLKKGELR